MLRRCESIDPRSLLKIGGQTWTLLCRVGACLQGAPWPGSAHCLPRETHATRNHPLTRDLHGCKAKQSRMDRVRILGGNSRDDCKRQRSLISNQIPGLREGKRRRKWNWAFRSRNDLKRILAFFLFYEFFCGTEEDEIACIAWTDSFTLSRWKRSHVRRWLR